MSNYIYIATSIDGYIADKKGGLAWLPHPDSTVDFVQQGGISFEDFVASIDAIVMGKNTFTTVVGFGGEWVYTKPVFVASSSMDSIPQAYQDKSNRHTGESDRYTQAVATARIP